MDAMPMMQMPSMFANLPNISMFPTPETAMRGAEQAKWGKEPFNVTDYKVKVFNMCRESDQKEYCDLMVRLMPLCQDAKAVVSKNELQVLNGPEGQCWFRYVEWFEYELNEKSLTGRVEPERRDEPEKGESHSDSTDFTDSTDDFDGIW